MDNYQIGLITVIFAAGLILAVYIVVDENKSAKWFKWYSQMDVQLQKNYNPIIAVKNLKKILLSIILIGIMGLLISLFCPVFSIITMGIVLLIFAFSIRYTGAKSCEKTK